YRVVLTAKTATCTCDDFQLRQQPCKHCLAVRFVLERECGGKAPAVDTDVLVPRVAAVAYGRSATTTSACTGRSSWPTITSAAMWSRCSRRSRGSWATACGAARMRR